MENKNKNQNATDTHSSAREGWKQFLGFIKMMKIPLLAVLCGLGMMYLFTWLLFMNV